MAEQWIRDVPQWVKDVAAQVDLAIGNPEILQKWGQQIRDWTRQWDPMVVMSESDRRKVRQEKPIRSPSGERTERRLVRVAPAPLLPPDQRGWTAEECVVILAAIHGAMSGEERQINPWASMSEWEQRIADVPFAVLCYRVREITEQEGWNRLHARICDAVSRTLGPEAVKAIDSPTKTAASSQSPRSRRRRRRLATDFKKLTGRQMEAIQLFGECKGNFAAVAKAMGLNRKTVVQHVNAAHAKLGKRAIEHATKAIRTDGRGQEIISTGDDGPGSKSLGPTRNVTRPRQR